MGAFWAPTDDHPSPAAKPAPRRAGRESGDPLAAGVGAPALTGTASALRAEGSGQLSASPGIYSDIAASGDATLSLSPGIYVVTGAMLVAGSAKVSSTGVSIYLAYASYPSRARGVRAVPGWLCPVTPALPPRPRHPRKALL